MIILSINSGSSSVKFMLFNYEKQETLATGIVERVTIGESFINYTAQGCDTQKIQYDCEDHGAAIDLILKTVVDEKIGVLKNINEISAVGHRTVHGGEKFKHSIKINDDVLKTVKSLYDLAPLHNPANVLGIEAAMKALPNVPHMAILDTAWHQTMPAHSYMYATPKEWYEKYSLRRYGFHGTSFLYVSKRASVLLRKDPLKCNLICLHIGSGVSANAIKNGLSYDTSMGLTPLEGLIMGTRAGDHDAALDFYIMDKESRSPKEMNSILNKKSGVFGITGKYTDRRDVIDAAEKGDAHAKLAIEMESYRIRKYIGAYMAAIGGADAIVFTAGVGEKACIIREIALEGLEFMGVKLDKQKNSLARTGNAEVEISANDSKVKIFVIPTDEERVFIEDVVGLLNGTYDVHTNFTYSFQSKNYVNPIRVAEFEKECIKNPQLKKLQVKP